MAGALLLSLCAAVSVSHFQALVFHNNLHVVIPYTVYRSAQPDPAELPRWVERLGLRSIINLRGDDEDWAWFQRERSAAERCGLELYSLHLRVDRLPGSQQLEELIDLLDRCPKPVLVHCRRGIDRTGLAGALARLLGGDSLELARKQYSLRHGYVAAFAQSDVPGVLDQYERWLTDLGRPHSRDLLCEWASGHYVPYGYRAEIEALEFPEQVPIQTRHPVCFRVTNRSPEPWQLSPKPDRGTHLGIKIHAADAGSGFATEVRGELSDRVVAPGESVVVKAKLPPLPSPGTYRVTVDLVEETVVWFAEMGSPPLVVDVSASPAGIAGSGRSLK